MDIDWRSFVLGLVAGGFLHAWWEAMQRQADVRAAKQQRERIISRTHARATPGWEDRAARLLSDDHDNGDTAGPDLDERLASPADGMAAQADDISAD